MFAGLACPEDILQNVGVNRDLHLLGRIIRPEGKIVDVRLFLDHVVQDGGEVLALVDGQLDRRPRWTLKRQIAVDQIVVDQQRRLGPDFDPIAVAFDLAFVVRVADRRQHRRGVELFDQLPRPNLGDKTSGYVVSRC